MAETLNREAIIQRARRIVEQASRPAPEEVSRLLRVLHEPPRGAAPEEGRLDVALALAPVAKELPVESRLLVALVLHEWDDVLAILEEQPDARTLLFHYLHSETPALRRWMLRHISPKFCRDDVERLVRDLASGNFVALRGWAAAEEFRPLLISLLYDLLRSPFWGLFHKDQAARLLRALGEKPPPVFRAGRRLREGDGTVISSSPLETQEDPEELAPLLQSLRARGLRVDGRRIYPKIRVGSVTGRVTYADPPLQTWSKEERERRIQPEEGHAIVRLDYGQIEPLVLLNILVHRLWLAIPDLPDGDVYLWFSPEDRNLGKRIVNTLINGGSPAVVDPHPKALRFIRAMEMFRREWAEECRARGHVATLAGRQIPLPEPPNAEGKMMNRLVQGSAADLFHAAVTQMHRGFTQEGWPGHVLFLLFDEVWVEVPEARANDVAELCAATMRAVARWFCPYRSPEVQVSVRR